MSKKLFTTVVVMAMLLASAAMAGELHYKVYGKAHVSTESLNNGDESDIFMSSNSTRLGVKGKYATDVEWATVVFQYESFADFNGEQGNALSSRNSYAGVHGENWGRVVWGRHDTPMKTLGRKVDFFGDRIGDSRNAIAYIGSGWDKRVPNMVMYNSPVIAEALTIALQYVPKEGVKDAMLFSGNAIWKGKKFMVGVAYESHGKAMEDAYNAAFPDSSEASGAFRVAAAFTPGKFKVAGVYHSVSKVGGYDVSGMAWGLGASYRANAWEPKAQYYMVDPNTDVDNDDGTMFAIAVDYHLNDMALLYLAYAAMSNGDMSDHWVATRGGHGQQYMYTDPDSGDVSRVKRGETSSGIALGLIATW